MISCFIDRLYTVNSFPFVTSTLIKRILKHFQTLNLSTKDDNSKEIQSFTDSYDLLSSSSSTSSIFQSLNQIQISSSEQQQPSSTSSSCGDSLKNDNAKYYLPTFVDNKSEEESLIYKFIFYLLEILFTNSTLYTKRCGNSLFLHTFVVDICGFLMKNTIELISDPSFINLQLLNIIRRYQFGKELYFDSVDNIPLGTALNTIKSHTVSQLQKCLHEHNFPRLCEIIDQCDEIDSLRAIRLLIVGEILNAAVIEHLSKSKDRRARGGRNKGSVEFNNNSNKNSNSVLRLLSLNSSNVTGNDNAVALDPNKQRHSKLSRVASFKLNVPESKAKILQSKDLRRFSNHLRFAKTVCEQKIRACKRQNAQQILTPRDRRNSLVSNSSFFEDSFSFFELPINNSDLIRTFTSPNNSLDGTIYQGKNVKKRIFQFRTIMVNDICREWLKRFVGNSLFSQNVMRSSINKFKINSLLSQCCSYLIEVWENCEKIFEKVYNFYDECEQNENFNELINDVYLLTLNIVCDERFVYTFSDRFLELPSGILIQIERFLLGQLPLSMIEPSPDYFNSKNFSQMTDFDPEIIENIPGISELVKLEFEPLWMIFFELEKIIGQCLQEEIYPQFLISSEYDQMLTDLDDQTRGKSSEFDFNPSSHAEKWRTQHNLGTKITETVRRRSGQCWSAGKTSFLKVKRPVQKITIGSEMVDITKNRNILLNSLEFGLGTFVYLKALCETRLKFKIFIKHLLTKNFKISSINGGCKTISEIANILKDDVVSHHSLYEILHTLSLRLFSWLHSDFKCSPNNFEIVHISPDRRNNQRPNTWRGNTFLSSFVGNILGSLDEKQNGEYDLHFTLSMSSNLSAEVLNSLGKKAQNQILSNYDWNVECSLVMLQKWLQDILSPNLRMLSFLSRFDLLDYLCVFTTNIEGKRKNNNLIGKKTYPSNWWNNVKKYLCQHETSLQRYMRVQIKKLEKKETLQKK